MPGAMSLPPTADKLALAAAIVDHCAAATTNATVIPDSAAMLARWAFDEKTRRCWPFYFAACDGGVQGGESKNNFATVADCEAACPANFPIELEVMAKVLNVEEGLETVLSFKVDGHPIPTVHWLHNDNHVDLFTEDRRLQLGEDR